MNVSSTLKAFDKLNAEDPNLVQSNGQTVAKELLYSQRMSKRLSIFLPEASELLQLAVHAQHIQRWKSPRSDYPEGRSGYIRWRKDLGAFHGKIAVSVMAEHGYNSDDCSRVESLLQKKNLKTDSDAQALEDVICLVFIEHYLLDFVGKYGDSGEYNYSEEKLFRIVQKTWKKMSSAGQAAALELPLDSNALNLIKSALAPLQDSSK